MHTYDHINTVIERPCLLHDGGTTIDAYCIKGRWFRELLLHLLCKFSGWCQDYSKRVSTHTGQETRQRVRFKLILWQSFTNTWKYLRFIATRPDLTSITLVMLLILMPKSFFWAMTELSKLLLVHIESQSYNSPSEILLSLKLSAMQLSLISSTKQDREDLREVKLQQQQPSL